MSALTTRLKDVLTTSGGDYSHKNGLTIVHNPELIGLGDYPIFDENYRETLNALIFMEYMNREIAHETDAIFKVRMNLHMFKYMPMFNKMYVAETIELDPLSTMNMVSESVRDESQVSDTQSDGSTATESGSKSRAVSSDTPQGPLQGNADYATSAADSHSSTTNDALSEQTSKASADTHGSARNTQSGYTGHAAELLQRYRDTLVSVDAQVVASVAPLFSMLLDTPFTYTRGNHYGYSN